MMILMMMTADMFIYNHCGCFKHIAIFSFSTVDKYVEWLPVSITTRRNLNLLDRLWSADFNVTGFIVSVYGNGNE